MASGLEIEVKIEELCRTCLTKENEFHSLFDVFIETVSLNLMVTSVTGLKIGRNDGLPSVICSECKDNVQKAFEFKKKSENALITLKSLIKKDKKNCTQANIIKTEVSLHDIDEPDNFRDNSMPISFEPDTNICDSVDGYLFILNDGQPAQNKHKNVSSPDDDYEHAAEETKIEVINNDFTFPIKPEANISDHKTEKVIKVEFEDNSDNYSMSLCPLCGAFYNGAENLTTHMWKYHADLMGAKKRGRSKKYMTTTILTKLSGNGFRITPLSKTKLECVLCKQSFDTKDDLDVHFKTHKNQKVLCCVYCKKMYLDKENYDQHSCKDKTKDKESDDSDDASNDEANSKLIPFHSELSLQEVMAPEEREYPEGKSVHVCSMCTRLFLSEDELTNHHDSEHPELSRRCNLCSKEFASTRFAARHRSICKQVERKFKCTTCGLKFAYQISLNKHILRYHEGQSVAVRFIDPKTKMENRQFQCDTCNRCFHRRDQLVKHTKIHMTAEKFFQCDVCQKRFNRKDNLRSHQKVHEANRPKATNNSSLCLYCGRSFSNSSNMIVHMRRHTGEKPYKCDFCDKGFPRSSDLQCHRRSHTGEKPCVCRVCGKAFSRSNKLTRHMRVHTGQRPYKCTYCDKAFSQSNDLTLHIRRHTGDRPYICEMCGDRFIQGTALQNHRRAHGHFPPSHSDANTVQTLSFPVQNTSLNQ